MKINSYFVQILEFFKVNLQIKKNIILAKCIKKKLTKREKKKKISKNIDIVFLFLFLYELKSNCIPLTLF
jgi:hypothetical protein